MADSRPNSKKEGRLTGDWSRQGPLEGNYDPSQPPAHGSDLLPRQAPQVFGGTWDWDLGWRHGHDDNDSILDLFILDFVPDQKTLHRQFEE